MLHTVRKNLESLAAWDYHSYASVSPSVKEGSCNLLLAPGLVEGGSQSVNTWKAFGTVPAIGSILGQCKLTMLTMFVIIFLCPYNVRGGFSHLLDQHSLMTLFCM